MKKRKKKIKTLDIVLLCVFGYMIYLNWQTLEVFKEFGSAPETAWCALIAALIGECGICGWIKTSKERNRRKKEETDDFEMEEDQEDEEL